MMKLRPQRMTIMKTWGPIQLGENAGKNAGENPDENPGKNPVKKLQ